MAPAVRMAGTQSSVEEAEALERQIRQFLVSIAGVLKRDCKIEDWKQEFATDGDDNYVSVQMFPKLWELPNASPVALLITFSNPFVHPQPEDLAVELRIPHNWKHAQGLRDLVRLYLPDGFTNSYTADADKSIPHEPFKYFVGQSRFDLAGFYQAILSIFRRLLALRPVIDDYISQYGGGLEQQVRSRRYASLRDLNNSVIQ